MLKKIIRNEKRGCLGVAGADNETDEMLSDIREQHGKGRKKESLYFDCRLNSGFGTIFLQSASIRSSRTFQSRNIFRDYGIIIFSYDTLR